MSGRPTPRVNKPGWRKCPACTLDGGWIYDADGSMYRCDHGELERAVRAAEEADKARAIRSRYDTDERDEEGT